MWWGALRNTRFPGHKRADTRAPTPPDRRPFIGHHNRTLRPRSSSLGLHRRLNIAVIGRSARTATLNQSR